MRLVIVLLISFAAGAQEREFDVQSRLVVVPVRVTDSEGSAVEDLGESDFVLFDNGRRQKILVDTFATGVAPISLIVAIQSSGISAAALDKIRRIGSMIQPLITGDRGCAGVVSFDERVNWLQDCTSDPNALTTAFQKLRPGADKAGCMLDAVHEAIRSLKSRMNSRRVLVLISESRDRGSETSLEDVVIDAEAAGVVVYPFTYSAFRTAFTNKPSQRPVQQEPVPPKHPRQSPSHANIPVPPPEQRMDILGGIGELIRLGKKNDIEILARATGGGIFSFTRQKGLEDAVEKLAGELHTQYLLSFVPDQPTPGRHQLEVRVTRGDRLQVRARPAYWVAE